MAQSRITHPYQGHYMEAAFGGFMNFASRHLMDQFEADAGPIRLGRTAIERAIDAATGHDLAEAQRFVDWCVTEFGTPEQVESVHENA